MYYTQLQKQDRFDGVIEYAILSGDKANGTALLSDTATLSNGRKPMIDKKIREDLSDLSRHLCEALPESLRGVRDDLEKTFYDVLQSTFAKCDLVTREEFDVQSQVLARTRQKVEALEKQVIALEKKCG